MAAPTGLGAAAGARGSLLGAGIDDGFTSASVTNSRQQDPHCSH
jgi:hypothetical protein